jgi:hypothetical protein
MEEESWAMSLTTRSGANEYRKGNAIPDFLTFGDALTRHARGKQVCGDRDFFICQRCTIFHVGTISYAELR